MLAFVKDKGATSPPCLDDLAEIDFGDNAELAAEVFQQGSIWEDRCSPMPPQKGAGGPARVGGASARRRERARQ